MLGETRNFWQRALCRALDAALPDVTLMIFPRMGLCCVSLLALSACVTPSLPDLTDVKNLIIPVAPVMGWDHREEAPQWTASTLAAIEAQDAHLAARVPGDIGLWCPAYESADLPDRRAFWSGLLSAVAKYESTWNPEASGGGGRYIGLMQISPATAANYDCDATSSSALKDGSANLACAVKIAAAQVGRDGMVAGEGNRGVARDWGPMKSSSKRAAIASWTAAQDYCQAG